MILTAITSDLVIERAAGLKHLQLVSGMKLMAFWSANFLFDFCRIYVLILVSIAMFAGYDLGYTGSIIVLLIFPFAVLPFTYVISFIFPNDNTAQAFTMFIHFFFLSIGAVILGFLRW
jgi:ATP-binding cassette, subfamily A (ABC1), member 3